MLGQISLAGSELDPTSQELAARGPEVDQLGEFRQNAIGSHAASTFLLPLFSRLFFTPPSCYKDMCKKFFSLNVICVISLF